MKTYDHVHLEMQKKYPQMAKRAAKGSRAAAIRMFCLVCMGGCAAEVKVCQATLCPLYSYRMGKHDRSQSP